jgi:hypothetical protein
MSHNTPTRVIAPVANITVLQTLKARIAGKEAIVEQIKLATGRQDIAYRVNGRLFESNQFWALKPLFIGRK